MWGSLLAGIFARPSARRLATIAVVALTIIFFLINLRRMGERVGRAAERLDIQERANAIHRQMLEAAVRRPRSRDDLLERLRDGGF